MLEDLAIRFEQLSPTADPSAPRFRLNEPRAAPAVRLEATTEEALTVLRRASPAQRPIPRVLNLDVGLTRDASVGGIAAFAVEQGREYGLRLPRPSSGSPDLDQQAAVLLGLDADTAQALFDGPNDIGGARRWIEPADAAKACRLAAAGARPTELWPDVDTGKLRELARSETIEMYRPDGRCRDAHGNSYGYSLGVVTLSAVSSDTPLGGSLISPHADIIPAPE